MIVSLRDAMRIDIPRSILIAQTRFQSRRLPFSAISTLSGKFGQLFCVLMNVRFVLDISPRVMPSKLCQRRQNEGNVSLRSSPEGSTAALSTTTCL